MGGVMRTLGTLALILAALCVLGPVLWFMPGLIRRLCERRAARRFAREVQQYLREEEEKVWRG